MKQGYAFGTRIRLSEEIIKILKCTSCLITIYFESNFGSSLFFSWQYFHREVTTYLISCLRQCKKEYNIPKLQIITEFTR